MMDIREHNRKAWDKQVENRNEWTLPVSAEAIAAARRGEWGLLLTPTKTVPRDWYPTLPGADVLCLASGGGQQGPILAAVGARVTVFDNSPAQLAQDRLVAEREGLPLVTVEGDMRNLEQRILSASLEDLEAESATVASLAELARVCRGVVVLSVPSEPVWRIGNMARGRYPVSYTHLTLPTIYSV